MSEEGDMSELSGMDFLSDLTLADYLEYLAINLSSYDFNETFGDYSAAAAGRGEHQSKGLFSFDSSLASQTSAITYVLIVLFSASFLAGFCGNLLALGAVCCHRKYQNARRPLLVTSLIVSNFLVVSVCIPFTLLTHIQGQLLHGELLCKLLPFLHGTSVFSGVFVLFTVALRHLYLARYPREGDWVLGTAFSTGLLLVTWVASLLLSSPLLYVTKFTSRSVMGVMRVTMCEEVWPHHVSRHVYNSSIFVLSYILPHGSLLAAYVKLMWVRTNPSPTDHLKEAGGGGGGGATGAEAEGGGADGAVTADTSIKLLRYLVALYAVLWLPYHVILIYLDSQIEAQHIPYLATHVFPVAQWLALSYSALHPLLYCIFGRDYRHLLVSMCCSRPAPHDPAHIRGLFIVPLTTASSPMTNPACPEETRGGPRDGKELLEVETVL